MKKSHKIKHGGKREGSGRKPLAEGEDTVLFIGKVPESTAERVDAARGTTSRSAVVRDALDLWLKKHG